MHPCSDNFVGPPGPAGVALEQAVLIRDCLRCVVGHVASPQAEALSPSQISGLVGTRQAPRHRIMVRSVIRVDPELFATARLARFEVRAVGEALNLRSQRGGAELGSYPESVL